MIIQRGHLVSGLLVVSIALNLLLVGGILGRLLTGPPPLRSFPPTMGWVMRGLEPEERESIRPLLADHMKDTLASQRALASAQRKVTRLLSADTVDETALTNAFADLRQASSASQEAMHAALVRVMVQLTPEQRERVVRYMRGGWRGDAGRRPGARRGMRPQRGRAGMPPPPNPEIDDAGGPPPPPGVDEGPAPAPDEP